VEEGEEEEAKHFPAFLSQYKARSELIHGMGAVGKERE
jgi:hypothetical protein